MKDEKQTVILNSISRSTRASNHVFLVIWNAFIETVLLTIVNEQSLLSHCHYKNALLFLGKKHGSLLYKLIPYKSWRHALLIFNRITNSSCIYILATYTIIRRIKLSLLVLNVYKLFFTRILSSSDASLTSPSNEILAIKITFVSFDRTCK